MTGRCRTTQGTAFLPWLVGFCVPMTRPASLTRSDQPTRPTLIKEGRPTTFDYLAIRLIILFSVEAKLRFTKTNRFSIVFKMQL